MIIEITASTGVGDGLYYMLVAAGAQASDEAPTFGNKSDSQPSLKQIMNTNRNAVGWFEIYVQDIERARAFYENTFQVTLRRLQSPDVEIWAFPMQPEKPGCAGAIIKMSGKDSGVGGTIVYFSCADCSVEAARASKNGGKIQRDKFSIGEYGFISLIVDTEGNMIGLHSMQ